MTQLQEYLRNQKRKICTREKCNRFHKAKGLCHKHYDIRRKRRVYWVEKSKKILRTLDKTREDEYLNCIKTFHHGAYNYMDFSAYISDKNLCPLYHSIVEELDYLVGVVTGKVIPRELLD